ncbi:MAG: radical SAM protein [Verrucomicrobia bacterium]|nr:radical SAM protein [Verrucomicrobiota bacterium]
MQRNWVALSRSVDLTKTVTEGLCFATLDALVAIGAAQGELHEQARQIASTCFGRRVFVRAVVEVSNYCRENCRYCGMRRDNRRLDRFRARLDLLQELLLHHRPSSVTDINIQAGEDPIVVREVVLPLIKTLRAQTQLGISVCLGTLNSQLYANLQQTGASIYIMKFEMADSQNYSEMGGPGALSERVDHIRTLARMGWHVSSGFIVGLPGQGPQDLLANLAFACELPLDGCSVSPFIPGDETPLAAAPSGSIDLTLNCMAGLRLMRPGWVIPAVSALNLAEPGTGYRRGLRCGANLVTINLTPKELRGDYLLYKRDRFIMTEERILSAISAEGLTPSTQSLAAFYQQRESCLNVGAGHRLGAVHPQVVG